MSEEASSENLEPEGVEATAVVDVNAILIQGLQFQVDSLERQLATKGLPDLAAQIAKIIHTDLAKMMPSVKAVMQNFYKFQETVLKEFEKTNNGEESNKKLAYKLMNHHQEIILINSKLTPERVKMFARIENDLSNFGKDMKMMQLDMEQKVGMEQIEECMERFRGYATRESVQQLQDDMNDFATADEVEKAFKELQRVRDAAFTYATKNEINERFASSLADITEKLAAKVTVDYVDVRLSPGEKKLAKVTFDLEKIQGRVEQRLREFDQNLGKLAGDIVAHARKMKFFVRKEDEQKIWQHFRGYATTAQFKDLYERCMPAIAGFETRLVDYDLENKKHREMIRSFDFNINLKASKYNLGRLEEVVEGQCSKKTEIKEFRSTLLNQMAENTKKLDNGVSALTQISDKLRAQITKTLIDAKAEFRQSVLEDEANGGLQGPGGIPYAVAAQLDTKAESTELKNVADSKASKADCEMSLRQIDIIHKQIKQLSLLVTEKLRFSLEAKNTESMHSKTNKKVSMLHQALLISQWVQNFDTTNVNDCFDNVYNFLPSQLQEYEFQINEELQKVESMKLSPNFSHLNDQVKNSSNSLIAQMGTKGMKKVVRLGKNSGVSPGLRAKLQATNFNTTQVSVSDLDVMLSPDAHFKQSKKRISKSNYRSPINFLDRDKSITGMQGLSPKARLMLANHTYGSNPAGVGGKRQSSNLSTLISEVHQTEPNERYYHKHAMTMNNTNDGFNVGQRPMQSLVAAKMHATSDAFMTRQPSVTAEFLNEKFHNATGRPSIEQMDTGGGLDSVGTAAEIINSYTQARSGLNQTATSLFATPGPGTRLAGSELRQGDLTGSYLPGIYNNK